MGSSCNGVICEFSGIFWVCILVFFKGVFWEISFHHLEFLAGFLLDFLLRVQWTVPLESPNYFLEIRGRVGGYFQVHQQVHIQYHHGFVYDPEDYPRMG